MYDMYGMVKIEKYSCNKGENFVLESCIIPPILPKCGKIREPEDEHCVLQCTQYN